MKPSILIRGSSLLLCGATWTFLAVAETLPTLRLENNQPFRINMPITIRGLALGEGQWMANGKPVQMLGSNAVLIADVAPGGKNEIAIKAGTIAEQNAFVVKPASHGVALIYSGKELGQLSWDIFLKSAKATSQDDKQPPPEDFDAAFKALPFIFQKTAHGAVFDLWSAETVKAGLKLRIELLAYRNGFLDVNAEFTNESADENAKVYAAVVCRWEQPTAKSRMLCYDNRIAPLGENSASPFRLEEGRHQFTQRGVDWVRNVFGNGVTVAWLNDFAPSFTVLDNSTRNTYKQPRYEGASLPQLGQEVQTVGHKFYSITEIARSNIKSYRDRLAENTLPARGEGVKFSSRLVLSKKSFSDAETDQMLVGYTSYNEQRKTSDGAAISFGVKSVKFGTSYFPYSTLGENFDTLKLPGMDREAFWPLAADTVLRWREFADDIRRDLRIAKAMGFQFIRLHHLELLAAIPKNVRTEYLDFLFGELRHLKLQAMLDTYATDAAIVELLTRYGDVIDTVEIENEVLIWGIPLDRPPQWKATYAAVKKAAPHVRVHLTGYNNTGMFNRLERLGIPFDRVGLHSYVDSLEAIPTARGYALALGSFSSKIGKPPVVTEYNWRQLTRMTPTARAKVYPAIFDNMLSTRAIPEMYQFQFNETMAPNPRSGRGNILRHYELIHLSRRAKLEALELMKLIKKYSSEEDALRLLEVPQVIVNLDGHGAAKAVVKIKNASNHALNFTIVIESSTNLTVTSKSLGKTTLKAGEAFSVPLTLKTLDATPGFYQGFLRIETSDGQLRYGWIEARLAGTPKLDMESKSSVGYPRGAAEELNIDFKRPVVVVYGVDAPVLEVETAFAIASTLESASGQPIEMIQLNDLPKFTGQLRNLIMVGTPKSNERIAFASAQRPELKSGQVERFTDPNQEQWLVVTGEDSLAVEHAGMDLLLRWWKHAKDSAARRVGLVEKELPRGGDATKLP
ncbi:MAG: hypothetical protein ABIR24_14385 [Verrucomicrobiota bacterium]